MSPPCLSRQHVTGERVELTDKPDSRELEVGPVTNVESLIGLGSNLGDSRSQLEQAVERLAGLAGVEVRGRSADVESRPVGGPPGQPCYLNGAVRIRSALPAGELLAALHDIEHQLGRRRGVRWGPRPIDLDLLLHGDEVHHPRPAVDLLSSSQLSNGGVIVPHPRLLVRRFALAPAVEIAPEWQHPLAHATLSDLLRQLDDPLAPTVIAEWNAPGAIVRLRNDPRLAHAAGRLTTVDELTQPDVAWRLLILVAPPDEAYSQVAASRLALRPATPLWIVSPTPYERLVEELIAVLSDLDRA